jgi:hypothetical protein
VKRALLALGLVLAAACGKGVEKQKAPPPEITGLAAVPASAEVVVGANVEKLSASPLVKKAVEQLFLREGSFATKWAHVRDACKLDLLKQVTYVMLALGPTPAGKPMGTGPVLMVATGGLPEADLSACVRSMVGKGGGSLTVKALADRSLYHVKDGNQEMYFAYGAPQTVVMSSNEAFITEALGPGPKAPTSAVLKPLLALANQNAPLWSAGKLPKQLETGLVDVTGGKLSAGPAGYVGLVDPSTGMVVELGGLMAKPEDAKVIESMAKSELGLLVAAAQMKQLGSIVNKLTARTEGTLVRLRLELTTEDINTLLSVLDAPAPPAQSPPPTP